MVFDDVLKWTYLEKRLSLISYILLNDRNEQNAWIMWNHMDGKFSQGNDNKENEIINRIFENINFFELLAQNNFWKFFVFFWNFFSTSLLQFVLLLVYFFIASKLAVWSFSNLPIESVAKCIVIPCKHCVDSNLTNDGCSEKTNHYHHFDRPSIAILPWLSCHPIFGVRHSWCPICLRSGIRRWIAFSWFWIKCSLVVDFLQRWQPWESHRPLHWMKIWWKGHGGQGIFINWIAIGWSSGIIGNWW